ncbi:MULTISPECIES: hypothetical protein [Gordonia]|uniref:Mce-associated membrane protein n=1 Tax=Gordonia hongkongensis TaxID=1701090 RepID=A0ABT6BU60_9ACTN|nr:MULTISPECIES: hypothetical protein [Gordonia]MBR7191120.1 hypothetical protein [Gordonia sp. SCSIO 19800]MCT1355567.1 hypothetical protein [Gordonia sp. p3-SID1431]MCX2754676.1 hypothetical protein [Gordonia sp. 4N]MDF6101250.1 hypothetical protein [Gordonia hongkongensis]MDT0219994.1 hypothetical protein [Gordonia sp. AC31]
MTPPTHTPGVEPVPGRGTTRPIGVRGAAIRLAIAAVVLVATLVVVLALWNSHRTGSDVAESRDQLRAQAGTIVADVFSVDADRWQQDRTRARERVADEFTDSYGAQLDRPPPEGTSSVTWRPEVVSIVAVDAAEGEALLRVVVTVRPAAGPATTVQRTVLARYARSDDTWLLAAADVIG